jgi:hypothetical protein
MAGNPYLYIFHVRLRDPENELGAQSDYMGVIGQWQDKPGGGKNHIESDALSPALLDQLGYTLPEIHRQINLALVRDLDGAEARSASLSVALDAEKTKTAQLEKDLAAALASQAASAAEESASAEKPSMLSKMTFGLIK